MLRSVYTILRQHRRHAFTRELRATQAITSMQRAGNGMSEEQDERVSATIKRVRNELAADKESLQWRSPIGDRPKDWNSKLKLFSNQDQTSDFIIAMQQPIDFSRKGLLNWYDARQERIERHMQQYVPERVEILGPELAAAHFLLYRGGAVRFVNERAWMRANEDNEFPLPSRYDPKYKVEALRCDNMLLYYEGLENLRCLHHLKFLSFHNVTTFDDWCLDRVSGSQHPKLEVLDISGTQCTARSLSCLYRVPTLKLLIVNDPKETLEWELTCAMLMEVIPSLKVVGAAAVHDGTKETV